MMLLLPQIKLLMVSALIISALLKESMAEDKTVDMLHHTVILTSPEALQELRKSPSVSVVYFLLNDYASTRSFLEEYDRSAKYLEAYNVTLAVFDCRSGTSGEEMCKQERVQLFVYTYQKGIHLLTLEVDTMFDVNSIMSNALQLALLQEVPIIQSRLERQDLQKSLVGKHDLLFAYPQAFGTKEHRIFMEIAYAFQDHFKFALTTEFKTTQGLQDRDLVAPETSFAMWVMLCTKTPAEDIAKSGDCRNSLYRGEISLAAVAAFVRRLSEPVVYRLPTDGIEDVFKHDKVPIVFVYNSKEVDEKVSPIVDIMALELHGFTKVIVWDMDNEECQAHAKEQGLPEKLPAVAVKFENGTITFMDPKKEWKEENLQEFLLPIIFPEEPQDALQGGEVVRSTDLERQNEMDALIDEVETQDDQVAEAVFRLQLNKQKPANVPELVKATFYKTVKSADLMMVLFYLPFDHVGMAFLQDYNVAADAIMAKNFPETPILFRVNCFDATDLCSAENITTYPLLRIYQKDQEAQEYLGPLDSKSVIKAVKLLQLKSPVMLTSEEDTESFMKGEHPKQFHEVSPTSVLFLASKQNSDDEKMFREIAKSFSTVTAFAVAHGSLAKTLSKKYEVSLPAIVAHHRDDHNKPFRTLSAPFSVSSLTDFVKESLYATVPELTVMSFPDLFARKKPFAILWLDPSDPVSKTAQETFNSVAMSKQFDSVTFCWMNAQTKTIGLSILSEYVWTATLPMISVVSHREGEVYNYQAEELKLQDITEWLARVVDKKEKPSKILEQGKWGPPGRYYNFLEFIEKEHRGELSIERRPDDDLEEQGSPQSEAKKLGDANDVTLQEDSEIRQELLDTQVTRMLNKKKEREMREAARKHHMTEQNSMPAHPSHAASHTEL